VGYQAVLSAMLTPPSLTLISQTSRLSGEAFFDCLKEALEGGLRQVLVREKDMDSARLLAFCSRIRAATHPYDAKLIIHSQADIAQAVGADGVHVSSLDMQDMPAIRQWLGDDIFLSTACHNFAELKLAEQWGADLAFVSPVFHTQSHPDTPALGLDGFQQLAMATHLPVIALGGIGAQNRELLCDYPVAVLSGLLDAKHPKATAQALSSPIRPSISPLAHPSAPCIQDAGV